MAKLPITPADAAASGGTAAVSVAREPERSGQHVGPYKLIRRVGCGGMGVVYEAVHEEIEQRIAVKILAVRLASDPIYRERFLREARTGSLVSHEGLVQIFGYGQLDDGTPYILMEYLDGQLLRARLARQPEGLLSLEEAMRLTRQIAVALTAAHESGVIHRDLKPENVMLISDAEVNGKVRARVLDFGIAKFLRAPDLRTLPAQGPLGTPTYMSPEQCHGNTALDAKSDVYSLGVMLYEMLCGRPPFRGDPDWVVQQHVYQDPSPPTEFRPEIPTPLTTLLLQMLAKEPGGRPAMAEVAKALGALSGAAHEPEQTGMRIALILTMFLLFLLGTALFGYYYHHYRSSSHPPAAMIRIQGAQIVMGSSVAEVQKTIDWAIKLKQCKECTPELYQRETPTRRVSVHSFLIDPTEVTNERYADWLNQVPNLRTDEWGRMVRNGEVSLIDLAQGVTEASPYAGIVYQNGTYRAKHDMARNPVTLVTWDGARRYCQAQGKRLPSEAEWELAARGSEGRMFPWGDNEPGCNDAVFNWSASALLCGSPRKGPDEVRTHPRDRTPQGVYDLGGNVAEWVADFYRERYLPCLDSCDSPEVTTESSSANERGRHVVRGGAWYREIDACRAAGRGQELGDVANGDIGFRCARDAPD